MDRPQLQAAPGGPTEPALVELTLLPEAIAYRRVQKFVIGEAQTKKTKETAAFKRRWLAIRIFPFPEPAGFSRRFA